MANDIVSLSVNEIKDLAVADFSDLTAKIGELSNYKLTQLGKKLAIPRYSMLTRDDLFKAIIGFLSTEQSEFAGAITAASSSEEEPSTEIEEVKERLITFQLLTNTSLEEKSYPASTQMLKILSDLNMTNKAVAIQGELLPKHRLNQSIEQLGVENCIVAVITKTANA